jgi:hypothetical protein
MQLKHVRNISWQILSTDLDPLTQTKNLQQVLKERLKPSHKILIQPLHPSLFLVKDTIRPTMPLVGFKIMNKQMPGSR